MSDQYVGEIRLFSGNYAPQGWAMCNGQSVPVNQNQALYAVIGNAYGGNSAAFNLPDLRGRIPVGSGTATTGTQYAVGSTGGSETVTLQIQELPAHSHAVKANQLPGTSDSPQNAFFAGSTIDLYANTAPNGTLRSAAISSEGGNVAHDNMMPFYTLTYIIALQGIYPTQS